MWITDRTAAPSSPTRRSAACSAVDRESLPGRPVADFLAAHDAERSVAAFSPTRAGRLERTELDLLGPGRPPRARRDLECAARRRRRRGHRDGGDPHRPHPRRKAEAQSEERFRWLADLVPQQIWIADRDGRIDFFNARVSEYFGPGAQLERTKDWRRLVHPDDLPALASIDASRAAGLPYSSPPGCGATTASTAMHVTHAVPALRRRRRGARWYGVTTDLTEAPRAGAPGGVRGQAPRGAARSPASPRSSGTPPAARSTPPRSSCAVRADAENSRLVGGARARPPRGPPEASRRPRTARSRRASRPARPPPRAAERHPAHGPRPRAADRRPRRGTRPARSWTSRSSAPPRPRPAAGSRPSARTAPRASSSRA